jgi:hypothetical protein
MNDHPPRLGIDIGNVLMAGDNDALFGTGPLGRGYVEADMLAMPEMDGAVEAIGRLVLSIFDSENVWLVSKAHRNTEAKTLRWLAYHDILARTALLPEHVWFCRARPDKAAICQSLGITYFVDDRPDVLFPMEGIVPHRYLFGGQPTATGAGLTPVADWKEAENAIRGDIPV